MDNVNKPAAICGGYGYRLYCCGHASGALGGLAWWLWAMDRATQWGNAAPAYRHGLYYLGDGTQPAGTGVYGLSTADKR